MLYALLNEYNNKKAYKKTLVEKLGVARDKIHRIFNGINNIEGSIFNVNTIDFYVRYWEIYSIIEYRVCKIYILTNWLKLKDLNLARGPRKLVFGFTWW